MGDRLVLVHGFTQTASSWNAVAASIAGVVQTPAVIDGADFAATAAALDRGSATYVGYSMGGRLCLQLALDRPEIVERLVLVSASPGITDPDERAARRAADAELARTIERDGVVAFLERWLAQPLFATLPRDAAGLDERRDAHTVESLVHQLSALGQGAQPSNWERLGELRIPVLLIVGELDTKYVDIARRMADSISHARVEVISGAGHACHLEQPEAVAHLLAAF